MITHIFWFQMPEASNMVACEYEQTKKKEKKRKKKAHTVLD